MMPVECEFESDVLAAVLQSRWPDRVDAHLREHVPHCAVCSDLAAVAGAIDEARGLEHEGFPGYAAIPDSGRVWWLAQLRARREAAQAAGRPITVAQVLAFACAMGLFGACFGATSTWFQSALRQVLPSATAVLAGHSALAAGMAGLLFLVPAAVYLAIRGD